MNREIKDQVYEFIIENFLFGERNGLKDKESLLENGIVDSIGVLELVAFIEGKFNIKVMDDEIVPENLDCIESMTCFIQHKIDGLNP